MKKVYGLTLICCGVMFLTLGKYHVEAIEDKLTIAKLDSNIRYYKVQDSIGKVHARINLILMNTITPRTERKLLTDSLYLLEIDKLY
jgi:hypothetical protein